MEKIEQVRIAASEQIQRALEQVEKDYKLLLEKNDSPGARLAVTRESYLPIVESLSRALGHLNP